MKKTIIILTLISLSLCHLSQEKIEEIKQINNPQSTIPNPQSPIPNPQEIKIRYNSFY